MYGEVLKRDFGEPAKLAKVATGKRRGLGELGTTSPCIATC